MSDTRIVVLALGILVAAYVLAMLVSIALAEGIEFVQCESAKLRRSFVAGLRSRTEELRRSYGVGNGQAGLEREA